MAACGAAQNAGMVAADMATKKIPLRQVLMDTFKQMGRSSAYVPTYATQACTSRLGYTCAPPLACSRH